MSSKEATGFCLSNEKRKAIYTHVKSEMLSLRDLKIVNIWSNPSALKLQLLAKVLNSGQRAVSAFTCIKQKLSSLAKVSNSIYITKTVQRGTYSVK